MPLHPQARALLDQIEALGLPKLNELPPDQAREAARGLIEFVGTGPEVARVEAITVPTSAGEIAGRRYTPEDPAATILWIHGGGFVICDLDTHDAMCRLLANESGCEVIAIDYRLAPEHRFPAALEDSWDALQWVASQTEGRPLILGGDSAGGNMTAACTLRARDRGGPDLALQVLVYPAVGSDLTTESAQLYGSGPDTFLTTAEMEWFWNHYVGDAPDDSLQELAPLGAEDHSGLPPAIVVTAEYDPLRDDGFAYIKALQDAGVSVTPYHYDDVFHAFFSLVNLIERGNEAVAQVGADIRSVVAQAKAPA
ncbi:MAG TPA: alpha/beta hydrolase [Solirubrobacteraceae bacterium]|nr:alpha/beta hydrolase [Solirubrobacteraceae bacterium]